MKPGTKGPKFSLVPGSVGAVRKLTSHDKGTSRSRDDGDGTTVEVLLQGDDNALAVRDALLLVTPTPGRLNCRLYGFSS